MIWPAESIYEGTWSSGPPPPEVVDFELTHEFKWTWRELQETPVYVRVVWWDLLAAKRTAQQIAARSRNQGTPHA